MGGAQFTGADFRGAQFFVRGLEQASRLFGSVAATPPAEQDRILRSAGTKIRGAFGARADFQDAFLPWATFTGSQLEASNFRGANLRGAVLTGTNLKSADLRQADLRRSELGAADLTGALVEGAVFRRATFDCYTKWPASVDVDGVGLREVRRPGVVYRDCP